MPEPLDLAAIRAYCAVATEGPWEAVVGGNFLQVWLAACWECRGRPRGTPNRVRDQTRRRI